VELAVPRWAIAQQGCSRQSEAKSREHGTGFEAVRFGDETGFAEVGF